ncbi:MAG: sigma-70 family RNA polymerase sigma factor [Eubacterium sp.]|nr:sigma-70 family RNA polymerase sigma factor [Eubacterium sp.]
MADYGKYGDEELIEMLREGDEDIMDYLLEKYKLLVRKKANAMYLMGGDTDDLIQEGMIGLYKAIRDYDKSKEAAFSTFAQLCISRQIYNVVEAAGRKKNSPLNNSLSLDIRDEPGAFGNEFESLVIHMANPESVYIDRENVERLEEKIEKTLSSYEKKVIGLYLNGYTYTQIAEILEKEPKSVDNALQRIKAKLV